MSPVVRGELADKVAIVTGGSSGIGWASARLFALEGAQVVIAARDRERGIAAALDIERDGGVVRFIRCDVTQAKEVEQLIGETVAAFGRLDILFNHAGTNRAAQVADLDEAQWDALLDANTKSVFLGCRYAIPAMLENGGGTIITTAGTFGLVARPAQAAYCASKAAAIHLTRQIALDYGPRGIRANCVCPGFIDTPLTAAVPPDVRDALIASQPIRRAGRPEDVAQAALFLASDRASFITGAVLPVDGGQMVAG